MAGVAAGTAAEKAFGEKGPPRVVIDETASVMITFAFLPLTAWALLAGFILNRVMDIVKPFPADRLQGLRGGWGIMMDDLVAGIYANLALRLGLALLALKG
ncbi:MAG: phosphatidylglycerophosphatase A [Chlamydiota bacterium]